MQMIVAALDEELDTARSLCSQVSRLRAEKAKIWRGVHKGETICLLKAGIGPRRSAANLDEAIELVNPSRILMIGYAGALDPELKLGSLVEVRKAVAFSLDEKSPSWDRVRIDGQFNLAEWKTLDAEAESIRLVLHAGDVLTSPYVLGDPAHKRLLFEQFKAAIVDMETAAMARIAEARGVPLSCIRVVSDEAQDTFLAPFSHDPSTGIPARAMKLIGTGMVDTYRQWKEHSSIARESLASFLARYL